MKSAKRKEQVYTSAYRSRAVLVSNRANGKAVDIPVVNIALRKAQFWGTAEWKDRDGAMY